MPDPFYSGLPNPQPVYLVNPPGGLTLYIGTPAAGVTAVEYGDGRIHQTELAINSALPAIAGGANLGVGKLLYTFPAGVQVIEGAYMSIGITQTQGNINADTPTVGIGTVIASGAIANLGGTATFEDIIEQQVAANCTGTATIIGMPPPGGVPIYTNVSDSKSVYFNVANGWSAGGDTAAKITGTVTILWRTLA